MFNAIVNAAHDEDSLDDSYDSFSKPDNGKPWDWYNEHKKPEADTILITDLFLMLNQTVICGTGLSHFTTR